MADTKVELDIPIMSEPEGDLDHWICCRNSDVSLCMRDVTDAEVRDFSEASCRVCEALVDSSFCPLGLVCPDDMFDD